MQVFTFAHSAEASAFIEHFGAKKIKAPIPIYQKDNDLFVITGEGVFEAITSLSFVLGSYPLINQVYNFGVVGSLGDHKIGEIYSIRHVYAHFESPQFKSFPLDMNSSIDLVSSTHRIQSEDLRTKLSFIASLVDRELWGLSYSCHQYKVILKSFKIVSDLATHELCNVVKDKAHEYSQQLLEYYLTNHQPYKSNENPTDHELLTFMSFYQQHEFKRLLQSLESLSGINSQTIWSLPEIKTIMETNQTPKNKAKLILNFLKLKTDPFSTQFQSHLNEFLKDIEKNDLSLKLSNLEDSTLELKLSFKSQQELMDKLKPVQSFDWQKFEKILSGDFHVG